jgi:hypothetical protein
MENRIIESPTELDDRDLDLVSGGGGNYCGGGGGGGSGGTLQVGLVNLNDVNVLSGIGILGIGLAG